jgi:hypothetical protein
LASKGSEKGQIRAQETPLQDLPQQEAERGGIGRDRSGMEFPLLQKVQLIFTDMVRAEVIGEGWKCVANCRIALM